LPLALDNDRIVAEGYIPLLLQGIAQSAHLPQQWQRDVIATPRRQHYTCTFAISSLKVLDVNTNIVKASLLGITQ